MTARGGYRGIHSISDVLSYTWHRDTATARLIWVLVHLAALNNTTTYQWRFKRYKLHSCHLSGLTVIFIFMQLYQVNTSVNTHSQLCIYIHAMYMDNMPHVFGRCDWIFQNSILAAVCTLLGIPRVHLAICHVSAAILWEETGTSDDLESE